MTEDLHSSDNGKWPAIYDAPGLSANCENPTVVSERIAELEAENGRLREALQSMRQEYDNAFLASAEEAIQGWAKKIEQALSEVRL